MPTFNGRTVVTVPDLPAPKSVEFTQQNIVAGNVSPFTGKEQILDWSANWLEASLTFAPIGNPTAAAAWALFLFSCGGKAKVFQLPAGWSVFLPPVDLKTGYWSLKSNAPKYSVSDAIRLFGIQFEIREVLA